MSTDQPTRPVLEHTVYLLRVWYEPSDQEPVWRASLHLPDGTPRRYFAVPSTLLAYLSTVLDPAHTTESLPAP
jgi:hypothetical protein